MPSNGRSAFGHNRSLSSILRSASPKPSQTQSKPASPSDSPSMTADTFANPSTPLHQRAFSSQSLDDDNDLSTIPDPRSRAMSPANAHAMASPHHPDLDQEVATLSTKLINAINHQTTLDDNLSATRAELENSRDKIRQLERVIEDQREMLAGDVWVRRKTVEVEKTTLLTRVAEEKAARLDMEDQKKKIEQELENLTAALFEEANNMVITAKEEARAEQEVLHRKNDQLKAQIADTEGLLKSQQEQLAQLKQVMEAMSIEKDEQSPPTVPSSPGFSRFDPRDLGSSDGMQHHSLAVPLSPSYPTSFTHLLQPVLRTDLAAYGDFKDLVRTSKRLSAQRLPPVSSNPGLTTFSIGPGSTSSHITTGNGSNSSLSAAGSPPATSPQTPNTPASSISGVSSVPAAPIFPHLKETRFYKRVLTEDIEPTLRLDTAPGLSWLARRGVITAMSEGTLVVEPNPSTATGRFGRIIKPELYPCSLCGESRKDEEYLRTHRFRTSESDSSQSGYPLCRYCLLRVRSTCDFLGFLRIVKDGHWRADDEDAEKAAWEESVRLREQMFWSRIGGGVLPTSQVHPSSCSATPSLRGDRSPRQSHDRVDKAAPSLGPVGQPQLDIATVIEEAALTDTQEPKQATAKETADADGGAAVAEEVVPLSARNSTQSLVPGPESSAEGAEVKRLSLTIPLSSGA
ncbi:hypothetical protein B0T26DRAFT_675558 [Lasiosphaeria miniovina]|uniref:GDP/GTP exchange factor Sec2 N-terminal domain-containing protein n=1 Tax=Lasiosphaeria miniovina TaxID=1954250 RepID=A0AA40AK23_9PEZI|nr:uncharacterized protein B0T26DRAFT_675558 [Lasiosphaeria miniovina]KAK0717220.1 hypothetical protein B0T26DRAFT_675558 [Lasiosphaeria miniovina]